ncbi:MAG: cytidylate kinase-like family protein [Acidobacteria bacterium]|nr:cytidylate kinase-like family protein [Acidobacteriota bacterium]
MCLIFISSRSFSSAELLAKRVSEELGYRWIEEDAIIERAAAWGIPQEQLRAVVQPIPAPQRWFSEGAGVELVALRAALAEEAASESVLSGREGFLLPRHTVPLLRIRLNVPLQCRIVSLRQQLGLTDAEAERRIRHADRAYRRWVRALSGSEDEDPESYDLVVNAPDGDLDSACGTIVAFVRRQTSLEAGSEYRRAMANFTLASRIEAVLKIMPYTAHLNASVRADRGLVFVAAKRWHPRDRTAIENVVSVISGVRRVVLVELRPGAQLNGPTLGNRTAAAWRPWAVGAAAWGLFVAGCVFLKHFDASTVADTSLTGVITDTRCAGHHHVSIDSDKPRCVRECVKVQNHVRYALFDGTQVYALKDQGVADQFAARTVMITGRLDPKTNLLDVRSIKPAFGTAESRSF